jgi:hypothetical protein
MNQVLIYALIGAVLGGAIGAMVGSAGEPGEIFIASNQPITVTQVEEKLRSEGWHDIQITKHGGYLEVAASKEGDGRKMMVDTISGHLIADDDD